LEKATEIGIHEIVPLICKRTEKQKFREERMQNILISAMLQSQQCWLPVLHKPIDYELLFREEEIIQTSQNSLLIVLKKKKEILLTLSMKHFFSNNFNRTRRRFYKRRSETRYSQPF
jgi:16S rRNA (uracil1498-N3)-methyltransferase